VKSVSCFNCETQLESGNNFCPKCGQRNHESEESFKDVIKDFFGNYLALDSRFGKTVIPFLFKPGYLTLRYREGKRMSYANPIRLYLILSLIFFLIFGIWAQQISKIAERKAEDSPTAQVLSKEKGVSFSIDTVSKTKGVTFSLDTSFIDNESFRTDSGDSKINWNKLFLYRQDHTVSNKALMDTIGASSLKPGYRYVMGQVIRITRSKPSDFVGFIFKNLPFMMLVLVPIFALILKLFYVRRSHFYITHLIHALHLHSFSYFLYSLAILVGLIFSKSNGTTSLIWFSALVLVTIYSYLSFLKVYKQGKSKTLIKFMITGMIYLFLGQILFGLEIMISSLLF
jgi:Protein of unknown function (DUF3667)